ncbi:MAG: decaprenyl-phosphate phosphoribosyltransferase [SAR324 cluster bacterium]|nr:decaprenyl-phosphate phosphoribosyltransferase [SAR324 cluster bacterium]
MDNVTSTLANYYKLLRPHQYVKNTFVLLPIFFAQHLTDIPALLHTMGVFVCFCLVASSIYIINDYRDMKEDRQHPTKKMRPLAAGLIPSHQALLLSFFLMSTGFYGAWMIRPEVMGVLSGYWLLNLVYSLGLKHIALLDIMTIATGFVLRIFAGGFAAQVKISMWIILLTFLLALFLAVAKRREDVLLLASGIQKTRKSIDGYNLEFINATMVLMSAVIVVAYIFYTISLEIRQNFHSDYLYLTVVFVLLGILRYMQITFVENKSGDPTRILLNDRFLQGTLIAWLGSFMFLIY